MLLEAYAMGILLPQKLRPPVIDGGGSGTMSAEDMGKQLTRPGKAGPARCVRVPSHRFVVPAGMGH